MFLICSGLLKVYIIMLVNLLNTGSRHNRYLLCVDKNSCNEITWSSQDKACFVINNVPDEFLIQKKTNFKKIKLLELFSCNSIILLFQQFVIRLSKLGVNLYEKHFEVTFLYIFLTTFQIEEYEWKMFLYICKYT